LDTPRLTPTRPSDSFVCDSAGFSYLCLGDADFFPESRWIVKAKVEAIIRQTLNE
jgi:hypothetical protein